MLRSQDLGHRPLGDNLAVGKRRDAILASLPNEPVNQERLAMDMRLRAMMKETLKRT